MQIKLIRSVILGVVLLFVTMTAGICSADEVNVEFVGAIFTGGLGSRATIEGNYIYVADGVNGLLIMDISTPASTHLVSKVDTHGATDVALSGNYAYVTDDYGLYIVDISNSSSPICLGSYNSTIGFVDIVVVGNYAYVTDAYGLVIVDISDPAAPTFVGSYDTARSAGGVAVSDNYAYLAVQDKGIYIVNVTNPSIPTLVSKIDTYNPNDIAILDKRAYVAVDDLCDVSGTCGGIVIYDITNPSAPTFLGSGHTADSAEDVTVSGNYAYVAASMDGLVIFDVSDPSSIRYSGGYQNCYVRGVAVEGNYVYLNDDINGLVFLLIDIQNQGPTEGSLVQVPGNLEVYLIENGMKRHFTSPEALEWNGHSFSDVIEISSESLVSISDGADISITQAIIDKYHALGGSPIFGPAVGTGELNGEPDSAGNYCSYVNFQNGAIDYFKNGPHVGEAYAIFNPLFTKWGQLGYGAGILGYPIEAMSEPQISKYGTSFRYQNFANGDELGALELNLSSGNVVEIHGAIFAKWGAEGYANSVLGLVISDERDAVTSFKGTTGKVSDFEKGHLHWHGSGDHYMATYMTYGELDDFYVSIGGTGSALGFPIKDQITNVDGHDYCEFEGGNISWDEQTSTYKVTLSTINNSPVVTSVTITNPESSSPTISWTFDDAEGDHQKEFRVEIWTGTEGTGEKIWSNHLFTPSYETAEITFYRGPGDGFLFEGHTYYVRVQIFDGTSWSDWHEASFVSLYHEEPSPKYELFTFVQITDMHVGSDDAGRNNENLKNVLYEINNLPIRPKCMLVTGDMVQYDNENNYDSWLIYGHFERFRDIMRGTSIYKAYVPGNHDRRLDLAGTLPFQDLDGYNRIISSMLQPNPTQVEFEIEGVKFIGLDSKEDYNTNIGATNDITLWDDTPESWGLSVNQMDYLRGLDKDQSKVIFMHHPAIQPTGVNDVSSWGVDDAVKENNLYGGNDGCIGFERDHFIDYCKDTNNNVKLVVTGHSHKNVVVSASGEEISQYSESYPIFLQTNSVTNRWGHYRIFTVYSDESIISESIVAKYQPHIYAELNCPANLRAYDSQNRYTGLKEAGEVELGIPNSFYEGRCNTSEPIIISLYDVDDEYQLEVVANLTNEQKSSPEIETFNLTVKQCLNETTNTTVTYNNVPLTENTVATIATNLTTTYYIMEIDSNDDGVKDDTRAPDSINVNGVETIVDSVPPQSITSLQSTKGTNWINWTWNNPTEQDFNHTEIYLNNIFQTNTSAEYFNIDVLEPEADYTISTRTVDNNGNVNETWVNSTATTIKAPIVVEAGFNQAVEEGASVNLNGSFTASGSHTYSYQWNFGDGTPVSNEQNPLHIYADDGEYTVTLTVTDDDGEVGTDTLVVTVNNVNPVLETITLPSDPYKVNTPVSVSSSFTDAGILDTHTAVWDFGDGTTTAGIVTEENGAGTVTGEHTYANTGIYKVTLTVTDDDGGSASVTSVNYVVVYNSEGGFVTAGGWINSPAGAVPDTTLAGKATFALESKYKKGATVPTDNTNFQFKIDNLNFKSTRCDWLVISGAQAIYQGTGNINGKGNYGFMLSAVDGEIKGDGIDRFRIKIWDKASGEIVYDNQIGDSENAEPTTAIGGGSIVIHKAK